LQDIVHGDSLPISVDYLHYTTSSQGCRDEIINTSQPEELPGQRIDSLQASSDIATAGFRKGLVNMGYCRTDDNTVFFHS
jgi:hypothetical protein